VTAAAGAAAATPAAATGSRRLREPVHC
jgi:hypothetical protein